jgi:two-component system, response regulator PdtaR
MTKRYNILIAEDDYFNLVGLKDSVEELGHVVVGEAMDGEDAIEEATVKSPNLILMDINMPKINGLEALKKINQEKVIPSIIISAYHDQELIEQATSEGIMNYLIKPVSTQDLKVAINISMAKFEEFQNLEDDLQNTKKALEARKFIEKAKGILMKRKELSEEEAFKALQLISKQKNKKILEVSKEIIQADELF